MNESLFQVSCPSCESVFAVTDPDLLGQIVACPKCGGMMLVEAAVATETPSQAEETQNGREGQNGQEEQTAQTTQNGEVAQDAESSVAAPPVVVEPGVAPPILSDENEPALEDADASERSDEIWGENEENNQDGEDLTAAKEGGERSRVAWILVGVAVVLVALGVLTVFCVLTRDGASEPGVKAENSESGENNQNNKNGEDSKNSEDGEPEEVGGFAPFVAEERTAADLPNAAEIAENWDETGELGELGELETTSASGDLGETEEIDDLGDSQEQEEGETVAENAETSSETGETDVAVEVEELDDGTGGLDDALAEGLETSEQADSTVDEGENAEETLKTPEKFAGSNDSTGFNEADFERANKNVDPETADEPAEVDWSGVASTTNPTLQGALPTLRRERKEIDVDARLALPIKSIEFPSSPVAAIRLLSELVGVSIVPDLETFVLTRPGTNATLDLSLRDATAGEALETVVGLLNWEVCKEKDRLLIRPAGFDPDAFVEERFDVADLVAKKSAALETTRLEKFELPNNLTPETLAAFVRSTVAPDSWLENGGRASLKIDGTALIVGQTAQNREKTRNLLEGLRAIRGLEPQTDAPPERIAPEKIGWENLTRKTTFNPLTPPAMQNAVEILEKAQKFQTIWDDATLNEAGVDRDAATSARVESGTLDAALSEILEPQNATYLILGERLILITSKEAARDYETVEFFSLLGDDGARPTLAEARVLIGELKTAVAASTWTVETEAPVAENGEDGEPAQIGEDGKKDAALTEGAALDLTAGTGENGENTESGEDTAFASTEERRGLVWLDVESSCLIVRQSQPNQRALRRWLAAREAGRKANGSKTAKAAPDEPREGENERAN